MTPGTVVVGHLSPGEWAACFGASLIDLMFYDLANERRVVSHPFGHMHKEAGSDQIYAGRNRVARTVLDESDAEWLWFVDSDMGFAADTVDRLVASADPVERPVVGGLCFAMKSDGSAPMFARRYRCQPTLYRMWDNADEVGFVPWFDYPRDQLIEVDATGGACLLIHRSVLELVRDRYGDHWFHHLPKPKGEGDFSEDLSFCLRLKSLDVPIHVDTSVKTTHDKGGVFLDEQTYDLQRSFNVAGGAAADGTVASSVPADV